MTSPRNLINLLLRRFVKPQPQLDLVTRTRLNYQRRIQELRAQMISIEAIDIGYLENEYYQCLRRQMDLVIKEAHIFLGEDGALMVTEEHLDALNSR